jgi:predicted phosphoribosyltransferase
MEMRFRDRVEAGRLLAEKLVEPFRNFPPCSLNGKIGI